MPKTEEQMIEENHFKQERPTRLNERGQEVLDSTPMQPPVGYKKSPSISDQIAQAVRSQRLAEEAAAAGFETFEEADDFDVGDDFDPETPFENEFDVPVKELKRRAKADRQRRESARETVDEASKKQAKKKSDDTSDGPQPNEKSVKNAED